MTTPTPTCEGCLERDGLLRNKQRVFDQMANVLATKFLQVIQLLAEDEPEVFTRIKEAYEASGEWGPLIAAQEELEKEQALNVRFQEVLAETEKICCLGKELPFLLRRQIRGLLDPGGLHLEEDGLQEE